MWDNIVLVLVGAAIPIFINWLQRKEGRKKFDLQRKDKYKLVAIEKRLEAHQQAFFHWNKLATIIHENDSYIRQSILESARDFYF